MSCLFGRNTKKDKNEEPDPFFQTTLDVVHEHIKPRCDNYCCQNKANFRLQECGHKVCAKCLNKSTKTFENEHRVCVCPCCQNLKYLPWLEIDVLIRNSKTINYCTTCFDEEAVFKAHCGHLMCSNCLENTDFCTTTKICKAFGCKQEFSPEEIKLALRNSPEIMVWRYFEIANYLQCDRCCNNKAILKVTLCRHSYCFPCLHQKEYSSAYTYCNRDVILCSSTCNVEIPRSVVQNCFRLFRKEAIMTAITLELSKEKCIRCKDEDLKTLRIKNRFCSYSHAYCILCCEYMKADSLSEQRPWLMSDVIEEQIGCIQNLCKSYTPLKCLVAIVETLTGKNIQTEIFIRNANFPRNCNKCRTSEADIVFVRCSHEFCVGCIDSRIQESSHIDYLQCIYRGCSTLIPLFVISELPKSTHSDGKSYDVNDMLVGKMCVEDTKKSEMHSKSQKDGVEINICGITRECVEKKIVCKSSVPDCGKKIEEIPKVELEGDIVQDGERLRLTANIFSKKDPKSVKWLKDGKELEYANDGKFEIKDSYKKMSILYVNNLGKEDEGEYTALVTTSIGAHVRESISFKLPEDPPKVELKMEKYLTSVKFRAEVISKWPVQKWVWCKDGHIIKERNYKFQEDTCTSSVRRRNLMITDLEESDYGFYSLMVITIGGRNESTRQQLKDDAPEVKLELKIIEKEKKVRIFARGNPKELALNLKWFHNSHEIVFHNQTKYTETTGVNNVFILGVHDVNREDEGNFSVRISNRSGKTTCKSVLFHITEDLPSVSLLFSKKEAEIVELIAEVRSTWPIEYFYWTKDGKSIPLDNSNCVYKFDSFKPNTYNLKIKNPRQEDEGEYKLVVESVAGRSESNGLFIRNVLGMKGMKGNLPCDLTENKKHNRSMLDNDNKKTNAQIHKSVESRLDGISRPYKTEVRCKICNKMATAIFQTCGHSFCLECLQRAVGSVDFPESTIQCPMDSCSSFATTETFREFMNRPHILHLEMPLFFKISLGQCKGKRCSEEGFINMSFCNHSLCMTCLESCKSASICVGEDCTNAGIPPARYFDHLLSAIKDKMQTPFMVWGADFTLENWKCSACKYPALYEIICCCHKVCAKCMKEMKTGGRIPIAIGKCPVNGCNELYPIPSYRNPSCERKTNANVKGSTLGQSERVNTSVVKPEKTVHVSHSLKKSRGLQNIAFSCYRNSILQILAETPGFYECLERICDKESNSWTNPLAEILHRIRTRNTADVEMFSILNSFHYQFNNTNIGFREYQQEDTLSFLMTLLNGLNDHYEKSKKNVDGLKNALDIFKGKFEDKYFCENCKKEESFNQSDFLSLPLLKKSSLFESFSYLFEEETIDMFPCSRCESRTLKKQLQICSFPDVLVLQLNREGNVYWTTDDDKTDFKEFLKDAWNEELSKKVILNEIKSYRLYGVVVHRGDEKGGHYVCFVRRRDESSWEECDDSVVTAANIKRVLRANAYLLFYEKCDSEV